MTLLKRRLPQFDTRPVQTDGGPDSAMAKRSRQFALFSDGPLGETHVEAHAFWDAGLYRTGRNRLEQKLRERVGPDSEWVHLQFHLALFDLELGDWDSAYWRYRSEILPLAIRAPCALTDAPSLLWCLELASPDDQSPDLSPHWIALREIALRDLRDPCSPLSEAHDLLALAGAKDIASLTEWLETSKERGPEERRYVVHFGKAIHACLSGEKETASLLFRRILPHFLNEIGGSTVQQKTFLDLADRCEQQSRFPDLSSLMLAA